MVAMVSLLCAKGADPARACDPQGNGALHWACFRSLTGVARELARLSAAASTTTKSGVDSANAAGETALHWYTRKGNSRMPHIAYACAPSAERDIFSEVESMMPQ